MIEYCDLVAISLPIFNAGSNRAALNEVPDALAVRSALAETTFGPTSADGSQQQELTNWPTRCIAQGYKVTWKSWTPNCPLYGAQQDLISLRLAEQSNRISLYKVLGGGWS
jgi:multidrug efflux system outer membrane protein